MYRQKNGSRRPHSRTRSGAPRRFDPRCATPHHGPYGSPRNPDPSIPRSAPRPAPRGLRPGPAMATGRFRFSKTSKTSCSRTGPCATRACSGSRTRDCRENAPGLGTIVRCSSWTARTLCIDSGPERPGWEVILAGFPRSCGEKTPRGIRSIRGSSPRSGERYARPIGPSMTSMTSMTWMTWMNAAPSWTGAFSFSAGAWPVQWP